jgi:hypothetical protein
MDSALTIVDSIKVFDGIGRLSKEKKADTEAMARISKGQDTTLLLMGSGSLSPYRDSCFIIGPFHKGSKRISLDTFYNRLANSGIGELNIEGAASIPGNIILANRGNKSFPKNHLLIVPNGFWQVQSTTPVAIIKAGINTDTAIFNGISGMDYSYRSDQLLLTVSTENTYNSYDDGSIGKSYLWIINDFSSKKRMSAVNPTEIIDLEETDPRFKGHKIESVCIVSESRREKELLLVADDDKGGTVLFKLRLTKSK